MGGGREHHTRSSAARQRLRAAAPINGGPSAAPKGKPVFALWIQGKRRDLSHFDHPGGNVISHYRSGEDATDAFETFHNRSAKARKVLNALPVLDSDEVEAHVDADTEVAVAAAADILSPIARRMDPAGEAITRDLGLLRDQLRSEGLFDLHPYPVLHFLGAYLLHDVGLVALSLLLVSKGYLASGMLLRAFAHVQRGGTMHDLGHNEVFRKSWGSDLCFSVFTTVGLGFCAHEWRYKHNRHHTSPNCEDLDGNVTQLPLFGWNRGWARRMTQRMLNAQVVMWYLVTPLLGLVMQITGLFWAKERGLRFELACMGAHFAVDYSAYLYLLGTQPGATALGVLGYVLLSQAFAGLYIHVIFMYNHQQLPMTSKDNLSLRDPCFARLQAGTAANYSPDPIMTYVSLGLNYQIEHHLFPEVPRRHLAKISARVQALCAEHKMPYRVTSHLEATRQMNEVLAHAATKEDGFPWMLSLLKDSMH